MAEATLSSKNQVVIPKEARKALGLEAPPHRAITSTVTMTELLVQPRREQDIRRVDDGFGLLSSFPHLDWVAPDLAIADLATRIRSDKTPDALQAATAISFKKRDALEEGTSDSLPAGRQKHNYRAIPCHGAEETCAAVLLPTVAFLLQIIGRIQAASQAADGGRIRLRLLKNDDVIPAQDEKQPVWRFHPMKTAAFYYQ